MFVSNFRKIHQSDWWHEYLKIIGNIDLLITAKMLIILSLQEYFEPFSVVLTNEKFGEYIVTRFDFLCDVK